MSESKPTAGAKRTTEALIEAGYIAVPKDFDNRAFVNRIAEIIDRKTASPDLLEACKPALKCQLDSMDENMVNDLEVAVNKAEKGQL